MSFMETNLPPSQHSSKIKPIIRRRLSFWDPVDFKIKKIIRRNIALHEKARYAKDSIFSEKLINPKLTSRKWTKRVNLSFVELREKTIGLLHFLKRHQSLTHFKVTFQESLNSENLVQLARTLTCASHLSSIVIELKYSSDFQEKGSSLHRFAFTLRKLPQLKENVVRIGEHNQLAFSLDLIKYDFLEIPSSSTLKQQQKLLTKNWIFRQTKLTTLMFDIQLQPELQTRNLKKLALSVSNNKKLKVLQISLPKETVILSANKIQPLLDSFLHLSNLQILKLSLKISNQQPSFLSHQAFRLPSLRKIYLKIEYIQPTLKVLTNKLQALSEIQKIYSLELDLSKSNLLNDETLKDIAKTIRKPSHLRKLSLKLQECKKVTENGIVSLLKTSSRLTKLRLDFTDCCSTQSISPHDQFHQNSDNENVISNLEKLSLSFANCQEITRVTFSLIQKLLLQAKNLQKLHLNFKGINKKLITPLPIFHSSLNHLKYISDLHLIFKDSQKISSRDDTLSSHDISQLGDFISKRKTLRNANLDVLKCKNIPQQFFTNFLNTLSHCSTLRNLTLSIDFLLDHDFLSAVEKFETRPTGNYKIKVLKYSNGYETTDHLHDTSL